VKAGTNLCKYLLKLKEEWLLTAR